MGRKVEEDSAFGSL